MMFEILNLICVFGTLLLGIVVSLHNYWRNKPSLIVQGEYILRRDRGKTEHAIRFDLTNSGHSKITVVVVGFKSKSDRGTTTLTTRDSYFVETELPKTLGESETYSVYARLSAFLQSGSIGYIFEDIEYIFAKDSTGKIFRSSKMPLQQERWNRSNPLGN